MERLARIRIVPSPVLATGLPIRPGPFSWESLYSVTIPSLTAGTHAIHAVFLGSIAGAGNFNDSVSGDITQTVPHDDHAAPRRTG